MRLITIVVSTLAAATSLFFIVVGLYSILIGLSPAAKNWSVNCAVFGGTVLSLVGLLGFIVGSVILSWGRHGDEMTDGARLCLDNPPIDDAQTGTSGLPLSGGMEEGFPITVPDANPGRFCIPRKEGFLTPTTRRAK